eukprot:tig00020855_g14692.t1
MVAAFTFAWKIIHALSDGKASCIQAFEPAWLRAQRLGFWQETASCPLTRFIIAHCAVDPTTYVAAPNTEGYMTSVAASSSTSRARRPRHLRRRRRDIENGRLDETLAGFGSSPLSLGESQPALEAIAIPVAQFKDPAPDVGPFLVKPTPRARQAHRNSAPAFLPPSPRHGPQQRPGSSASTRCCRARVPDERRAGPSGYGARPPPRAPTAPAPPGPGAVLTAIQGFGPSRRPSGGRWRRASARAEERRQALWASACRRPPPSAPSWRRASARSGMSAAEAVESWRRSRTDRGAAKGLGYSYRRRRCPPRTQGGRRASLRAKIDAAEEQAAREEAEDNARFRHLHHWPEAGPARLQFGEINAAIGATAGRALDGRGERFWHWLKSPYPLEPGVKRSDTEKVAFNKRKTYKAIREGQLLPTDSVPGLPGTTAGELLVRNLRLQYVSRLRRSKAKKARLDSGDSSSSS